MDKSTLRSHYLKIRSSMTVEARLPYDMRIFDTIVQQMGTAKRVGIYCSFKGEVDTYSLMEHWFMEGVEVCVPRVQDKHMDFYLITGFNDLEPGTLGILEPKDSCVRVTKETIAQMYIPMLAFNRERFRVGYGGGYYDRYLKTYTGVKIGLAYSFQETAVNFQGENDVKCDIITTDREVIVNHI